MHQDYGKVYKVQIEFNRELFNDIGEIKEFLEERLPDMVWVEDVEIEDIGIKMESLEGTRAELLWYVPDNEGVHEIEIELFYVLEDDKFGSFKCEFVR